MKYAATLVLLLLAALPATAAETDQYMTWTVELEDSGNELNQYLNDEAARFVEIRNKRTRPTETNEDMALGFYAYLFEGLHKSRVRSYLAESEEVDRFPCDSLSSWEYQRSSIYRELSFPFILPLSRTVRLGEVYLGIDKVGHFFGFGRRYCSQYLRLRDQGMGEEEAIEAVVRRGIFHETKLVGGLVDGIVSRGDLEANYQGMLMAKQLAGNTPPCFVKDENGDWRFEGAIDIVPYITPDMDESWNGSIFTGLRKRNVTRRLQDTYCGAEPPALVKERFEKYASFPESLSEQIIQQEYSEFPSTHPTLHAICEQPAKR